MLFEALLMSNLRIELDRSVAIRDPIKNIEYVNTLRNNIPHSIKLLEESDFTKNFYPNYNCYMFALDLLNSKEVDQKAQSTLGRVRPGNDFIKYLLNQEVLKEINFAELKFDDIIIYFDQNNPLHAGKVRSGKVISKWTIYGHLWEHGIDEVPLCFGSNRKYFRNISRALAVQSFSEYAKCKNNDGQHVN